MSSRRPLSLFLLGFCPLLAFAALQEGRLQWTLEPGMLDAGFAATNLTPEVETGEAAGKEAMVPGA